MANQSNHKSNAHQVLGQLEGTWIGEGQGYFPTIDPFDYKETLIFERRDETTLFYKQQTEKRPLGQTSYQTSHWESGFLRILPTGELELTNAQSGGRNEHLHGSVEVDGHAIWLRFESQLLTNDERMIASGRTFELNGNTLSYEMTMQTTRVDALMPHLIAKLNRVRQ